MDWGFPCLQAVTEAPALRPDGTILSEPGYDAASQLYYAPASGLALPYMADAPTQDHVDVAIEIVQDVIADSLL
jgi:hypothetical protein